MDSSAPALHYVLAERPPVTAYVVRQSPYLEDLYCLVRANNYQPGLTQERGSCLQCNPEFTISNHLGTCLPYCPIGTKNVGNFCHPCVDNFLEKDGT